MKGGAFYGYKCPNCGSKSDLKIVLGSDVPICRECRTTMVPDPEGKTSTMNAYCPKCNIHRGFVNSDICPTCGGKFSTS